MYIGDSETLSSAVTAAAWTVTEVSRLALRVELLGSVAVISLEEVIIVCELKSFSSFSSRILTVSIGSILNISSMS